MGYWRWHWFLYWIDQAATQWSYWAIGCMYCRQLMLRRFPRFPINKTENPHHSSCRPLPLHRSVPRSPRTDGILPDVSPSGRIFQCFPRSGKRLPRRHAPTRNASLWGSEDYWRIYEQGITTIAESYRDRSHRLPKGSRLRFLLVSECLAKMHALLAHARLVSAQIPAVNQIVVRMDWRGLHYRTLCWDAETVVFGGKSNRKPLFSRRSHSHGPNCVTRISLHYVALCCRFLQFSISQVSLVPRLG